MNPVNAENPSPVIEDHFRQVADSYDSYRQFDAEPVDYLVQSVPGDLQAICELGTGTGRYLLHLVQAFAAQGVVVREAYGVDSSTEMLARAKRAAPATAPRIEWVHGTADSTGIPDRRMTLVISFNSIHHFPVNETLRETARILRPGGRLAIYTRTRDQEMEHIWGRYFPGFVDRSHVPTSQQMKELSQGRPAFRLLDTHEFSFVRTTTFDWVCRQAWNKHYSTFARYPEKEFESAFARFRSTLRLMHADRGPILYRSSYTLFLYQLEDTRAQ